MSEQTTPRENEREDEEAAPGTTQEKGGAAKVGETSAERLEREKREREQQQSGR